MSAPTSPMDCPHCDLDRLGRHHNKCPARFDTLDKHAMYVLYGGPLDNFGKRPFTLWWWNGYQWRAQCFRADPQPILARAVLPVVELKHDLTYIGAKS